MRATSNPMYWPDIPIPAARNLRKKSLEKSCTFSSVKIESTVRYGIEVDDAIEIAEKIDI